MKLLMFVLLLISTSALYLYIKQKQSINRRNNKHNWFQGKFPKEELIEHYPLVFVHGLEGDAEDWITNNEMDELVWKKGYLSAYVQLYPKKNMWVNGEELANSLKQIYNFFEKELIVIGHSKGGIDAQAALVHFDSSPYVKSVFMLATPNYGSELADLAYSKWAQWLANLVGMKNEATYCLQTSYMRYFRHLTDKKEIIKKNDYFTLIGNDRGKMTSKLFWGGLYLSQYGENDGAVTVKSSQLPYATQVAVGNWDHYSIKQGEKVFEELSSYFNDRKPKNIIPNPMIQEKKSVLFRGGMFQNQHVETFYIDDTTRKFHLNWIGSKESTTLSLISPSGHIFSHFSVSKNEQSFFTNSFNFFISINHPETGMWQVKAFQSLQEGFFMHVFFLSDLTFRINKKQSTFCFNCSIPISSQFCKLCIDHCSQNQRLSSIIVNQTVSEKNEVPIVNQGEGMYYIELDIEGQTDKGNPFQRSVFKTYYIDSEGKMYE
ncbi:hypothetical protein LC087_04215 [Bacillus carboniphilus]|uniref:Lipase n=1 Tax=Bacillus carboniphilus TaxID=86663 RepID=A0ABY9JVF9_9BACI|nr:hypothetical protein [Bacillus carboniphilus]WLR43391.1 hypothetical protein LC087_04215 [Bacillus carboniphilus]